MCVRACHEAAWKLRGVSQRTPLKRRVVNRDRRCTRPTPLRLTRWRLLFILYLTSHSLYGVSTSSCQWPALPHTISILHYSSKPSSFKLQVEVRKCGKCGFILGDSWARLNRALWHHAPEIQLCDPRKKEFAIV